MTFKLTQRDIDYLLGCVIGSRGADWDKSEIEQKLVSIQAWMETMPPEDRLVYLLGRKA